MTRPDFTIPKAAQGDVGVKNPGGGERAFRFRPTIVLHDASHRRRAHAMIDAAPAGYRVTVAEPKRSDLQNDKMWAMIADIMKQLPDCFGPGLDKEDHKQVFMAALFGELRMARNADGDGYVPLARRSSRLTVREMADLITLIDAWAANHGIVWSARQGSIGGLV